jgi:hypothetical protein
MPTVCPCLELVIGVLKERLPYAPLVRVVNYAVLLNG